MLDSSYDRRLRRTMEITGAASEAPASIITSPTKNRVIPTRNTMGDRLIPTRAGNSWQVAFHMKEDQGPASSGSLRNNARASGAGPGEAGPNGTGGGVQAGNVAGATVGDAAGRDRSLFRSILENEVLNSGIEDPRELLNKKRRVFNYESPLKPENRVSQPYSLSPLSPASQKLLQSPRKAARKIAKVPFKVLDAPELQDDFYLNLVDWSSQNVLSVGLGACVYLWAAATSQVTRLCDLAPEGDSVTSVAWAERGHLVSVGTHRGTVQVWDVTTSKRIHTLEGHSARVGALAWNGDLLASGSRDRLILQRDIRTPPSIPQRRLSGHRQEVCGLKWSPDNQLLASGGNDNKLFVWGLHSVAPLQTFTEHLAAVKAIAWSPHHHGVLASGGGTADRCIRFWNTLTGQPMQYVDTGSQVCNLAWSKHSSELVSTHGYSQNQILIWKYPSLSQVAQLTGHSYRVLYLAMSPDGESIVTGAGDETLRFWSVFNKTRSQKETRSVLNLFTSLR